VTASATIYPTPLANLTEALEALIRDRGRWIDPA